jgi:hypothetical protein
MQPSREGENVQVGRRQNGAGLLAHSHARARTEQASLAQPMRASPTRGWTRPDTLVVPDGAIIPRGYRLGRR